MGTYGFYGGKFFPMHKGHQYCIEEMAKTCDHGVVIMFVNGLDEKNYLKNHPKEDYLSIEARAEQVARVCKKFPNLEWHIIDVGDLVLPDGTEDWEAETPLVRQYLPHIDYVFSSEPRYGPYFRDAYPEAIHIVVDAVREDVPISATEVRAMNEKERKLWMV